MNKLSDFDTQVEARLAFADRRRRLLRDWSEGTNDKNSRGYWAERLRALHDAELAVLGGVY